MIRFTFLALFFTALLYSQTQKKTLSVYFENNEFYINSESEQTLNNFFSNENIVVSTIIIDAFCDDVGETIDNKTLSDKRANSVAKYLYDTFSLEAKVISGKGEIPLQTTDENTDDIRKNNRKAVLKIVFSDKKTKVIKPEPTTSTIYKNNKSFDENLKIGDHIILEHLLFKSSTTTFENNEIAEMELAKIVKFLNDHPKAKIEIEGHVCCITKSFSDARDINSGKNNLSETRAKKIYVALLAKGFNKERLTYVGYGRQYPLENTKEELNKRVEIVVLEL